MKFFMTDIHGEFTGMEALLRVAEIDYTKDQLVFGGDYINRGKSSGSVIRRIKQLVEAYPSHVIALTGNHEEMMRDYYYNQDQLWLSHGGSDTIRNLEKTFPEADERNEHIDWACNLPLMYEDDTFIYTHAGLSPNDALDSQSREILWMSESEFYSIPRETLLALTRNKIIVHGHTPVERIYDDGVRLNCDLGCSTYWIEEERGLALVNLSQMIYYVYKQQTRKIEKREIIRF